MTTRTKNPNGRPLKFKNEKELQKKIEAYFKSCWDYKRDMFGNRIYDKATKPKQPVFIQIKPYTITGLAVALDTSRETLLNYEKRENFFDTIKRAKEKCHNYAEDSLFIGKNPTGAIFNLKNNYGWEDKSKQEHSGSLDLLGLLKKADEEQNN